MDFYRLFHTPMFYIFLAISAIIPAMISATTMMPDIDGFEFTRNVRELNENIPILFMTARDDIASKQRGFRIGVDDYMVKPIDLDELFLRIGALLRRAKIATDKRLQIGNFIMDS